MVCLLHLCQMRSGLTLCHLAGKCPEDADENSPGTDGNPPGSEALSQHWWPYTPCWSTPSRTCQCLGWDTWCSSQCQCFCLAAEVIWVSRIHSPIFPSSTWLHINYTVCSLYRNTSHLYLLRVAVFRLARLGVINRNGQCDCTSFPQIPANIVTPTCNALSQQFQYWASLKQIWLITSTGCWLLWIELHSK